MPYALASQYQRGVVVYERTHTSEKSPVFPPMSKKNRGAMAAPALSTRSATRSRAAAPEDTDEESPEPSRKGSSRHHRQPSRSQSESSPERPPPRKSGGGRQPSKRGRLSTATVDEVSDTSAAAVASRGRGRKSKSTRQPSPKRKRQHQQSPSPIDNNEVKIIDEVDDEVDEATVRC